MRWFRNEPILISTRKISIGQGKQSNKRTDPVYREAENVRRTTEMAIKRKDFDFYKSDIQGRSFRMKRKRLDPLLAESERSCLQV